MSSLEKLQSLLKVELDNLGFDQEPKGLYQPASYIISLGGKRMRPALALMACELFSRPEKAIKQALAVEVFHNFTLVHDDIMDEAPLRRGKTTVHQKWDLNTAILSGDVMLIKAYQLLAQCDAVLLPKLLQAFNKMAVEVCEGQQMDMDFESRNDVSEAEYIKMIQLKTSVLLGCALQLGAWVGGASDEDAAHLYQFGLLMGTSFQIKDDVLDCFGDPDSVGKQVGGDIISNKKTLLLLHALKHAEGTNAKNLMSWLSKEAFDPATKVTAIKDLYLKLGTKDYAEKVALEYYNQAIDHLDKVNSTKKQPLYSFAEQLLNRVN